MTGDTPLFKSRRIDFEFLTQTRYYSPRAIRIHELRVGNNIEHVLGLVGSFDEYNRYFLIKYTVVWK